MSSGTKIQRGDRKRRGHEVTLSDEVWAKLGQIARKQYGGNRSAVIEAMTLAASLVLVFFLAGCGGADGGPIDAPESVSPIQTSVDGGSAAARDGDTGPQSTDAGRVCEPATCASLAPQSGSLSDGCGRVLYCAPPTEEDDASACVPAVCGTIPGGAAYTMPDGCGQVLHCPGLSDPPPPDAGTSPPPKDAGEGSACTINGNECTTPPPFPEAQEWVAPECCSGYCAGAQCSP